MGKLIDLTGKTFGRYTVVKRVESPDRKNSRWLCQCACGNEREVSYPNLKTGRAGSCGCLWLERVRAPRGVAGLNRLFTSYKNKAADRGLKFCLSKGEFKLLTSTPCHYCGHPPNQESCAQNTKGESRIHARYVYNGIDRKDNTRGYTSENCVPSCGNCNRAKMAMNYQDFTSWLDRISKWRNP